MSLLRHNVYILTKSLNIQLATSDNEVNSFIAYVHRSLKLR